MESIIKEDIVYTKPRRSAFLTVLCILTFLGSAQGIFSSITAFASADMISKSAQQNINKKKSELDKQGKQKNASPFLASAEKVITKSSLKQNAIAGVLSNLLTFLGALLMFRLRPQGFWLYLAGTVLGIIAPLFIFGNNSLVGLMALLPGFFGIIFIVLYAFNLRDMRPQPVYD